MYNHLHNNDYKVLLIWFIDIDDAEYGLRDEQHDGDKNGMSSICDDPVKLFLILISFRKCMRYEVNCSIYWQSIVYDFLMLHLCYTYFNIVNYDVTFHIKHIHTSIVSFSCIHVQIILNISPVCDTFNNTIYNM